jgi:hypothetical protein
MSEVTLVNKSRVTHVIVLDHDAFRTTRFGFEVKTLDFADVRDGTRGTRKVRRATPGSLTLLPGASIEGLPPEIRQVPQVAALLQQRQVVIESPRGDSKSTAPSQTPRGDSEDRQDPGQEDRQRATLGRSRTRVEK